VLASASPREQKQILGERLFPLIQATHPDQAGKITGMLLDIDNTELLHLLKSRGALATKIQEAVSILRAHSATAPQHSVLASASPREQKQILGERLFPLIQATHPDHAGKITGMLLDIDNTELMHLLESREALAAKIQEAVSVLRAHTATAPRRRCQLPLKEPVLRTPC